MTDKDPDAAAKAALTPDKKAILASAVQTLRQKAESRLLDHTTPPAGDNEAAALDKAPQVIHELRVHQVELEMQNEALRESQVALEHIRARYFDLYDLAPVGYCTISVSGLIRQANLTLSNLLGVSRRTLVQRPFTQVVAKTDQDLYYLNRKRLVESEEPQTCELRMVKQDGTQIWIQLSLTAALDADGLFELRAVLTDITTRKQAETARQASEARLSGLIYSLPDAVIAIDAEHRIVLFNPAAERMFGVMAGDVMGASLDRLIPVRFRSFQSALIHKFEQSKASARSMGEPGKIFGLHANGSEFPMHASIAQIEINSEKLFTVVCRDVSEREHLYQMLEERSVAIERAMFVAEKANCAKSEFLSSMSHELRTPLNAILGFAQLLEAGTPPPTAPQKGKIEQILRAGWYLLDLVNEILDLALIESGKLIVSTETISLTEVVNECRAMIEPQAQIHGINVTFPNLGTPLFVHGDHTRVKQVLINLLSNAIKYNSVGGTVVVECMASTPGRIRICVTDSGEGLPADKLAQLFQPFNRLGQENSTEEGTGIGLVVSKRLVELMGGSLGVESTVGVGSVFWIELNLAIAPHTTESADQSTAAPLAPAMTDAPLRTVLYVEDNRANLLLVEEILARRTDLILLSAADAITGIKMARANRPDIILMDINLPDLSGLEALKILAADPTTAHIPLVALSANAMPHDIEEALSAGFFSYVTKPFKVNEFMQALDNALDFAKSHSSK